MKKKFKIFTLGCKTNQYESQAFADQLKQLGLISSDKDDLDICIINACSVTKTADKKTLMLIKNLRKRNEKTKFFVTGCLGKDIIGKIDEEIQIISNRQKHNLVSCIFPKKIIPKFNITNFENHTRAFVKIQDGCSSACSYCVIPSTRGKSISRNYRDILFEINKLAENGYKEIVLTGINIGDYFYSKVTFASLLNKIDKIKGLKRIKISSIDSSHLTDDVLKFLMRSKKIVLSLHLVLQSGSQRILTKMNRKYSIEDFLKKTQILKNFNSDFTFTTDIIVGFPDETNEDFEKTLDIVQKVKFAKIHIFPYSPRPDTSAALFKNQIPESIKNERKRILSGQALKVSLEKRKEFVGRTMKVLFEKPNERGIFGYTQNNLLVHIPGEKNIYANSILDVKLKKVHKDYIIAKLCK